MLLVYLLSFFLIDTNSFPYSNIKVLIQKLPINPIVISLHPTKNILAIGYRNGFTQLINAKDGRSLWNATHQGPIIDICWDSNNRIYIAHQKIVEQYNEQYEKIGSLQTFNKIQKMQIKSLNQSINYLVLSSKNQFSQTFFGQTITSPNVSYSTKIELNQRFMLDIELSSSGRFFYLAENTRQLFIKDSSLNFSQDVIVKKQFHFQILQLINSQFGNNNHLAVIGLSKQKKIQLYILNNQAKILNYIPFGKGQLKMVEYCGTQYLMGVVKEEKDMIYLWNRNKGYQFERKFDLQKISKEQIGQVYLGTCSSNLLTLVTSKGQVFIAQGYPSSVLVQYKDEIFIGLLMCFIGIIIRLIFIKKNIQIETGRQNSIIPPTKDGQIQEKPKRQ